MRFSGDGAAGSGCGVLLHSQFSPHWQADSEILRDSVQQECRVADFCREQQHRDSRTAFDGQQQTRAFSRGASEHATVSMQPHDPTAKFWAGAAIAASQIITRAAVWLNVRMPSSPLPLHSCLPESKQ